MLKIIVDGKLDCADGQFLITGVRNRRARHLGYYIGPYIGKRVFVFVDEPEEEPVLNNNFKELLVPA